MWCSWCLAIDTSILQFALVGSFEWTLHLCLGCSFPILLSCSPHAARCFMSFTCFFRGKCAKLWCTWPCIPRVAIWFLRFARIFTWVFWVILSDYALKKKIVLVNSKMIWLWKTSTLIALYSFAVLPVRWWKYSRPSSGMDHSVTCWSLKSKRPGHNIPHHHMAVSVISIQCKLACHSAHCVNTDHC